MELVLNTNSGMLHTKLCADGETGLPPVAAGSRQHFNSLDNARAHEDYKKDHQNEKCIG